MRESQPDRDLIEVPDLPRPDGGGSLGYGESFRLDTATGSAQLELPLDVPQARALTPKLTLRYDSSGANGLFGNGFSLDVPAISRRTSLGIPKYTSSDQFVTHTGDVLVPRYLNEGGRWVPDRRRVEEGGRPFTVVRYRRRIEQAFDRIEQWFDEQTGASFWRITDRDNTTLEYGRTAAARVCDPQAPARVFRWMAETHWDACGNLAEYAYAQEGGPQYASLYPRSVRYGNFEQEGGAEAYAFELSFLYGDEPRPDVLDSFRAGFQIRTARLCAGISVSHYFPEALGDEPLVVGVTRMEYALEAGVSVMTSLTRTGRRRLDDGSIIEQALPALRFGYSAWTPSEAVFAPLDAEGRQPPPSLAERSRLRFVDLYGDGLSGILDDRSDSGDGPRYWRPQGNGRYAGAAPLPVAPVTPLEAPGRTTLLDLSGEGKRDSVVLAPGRCGYFSNHNDGAWGPWTPLRSAPTDLAAATGTFVDLTGDGRADFLDAGPLDWRASESRGRDGFGPTRSVPPPTGTSRYSSDTEAEFVGFVDIFGDGLSHLVALSSGQLRVWPSLGYGRFAPARDIPGVPIFEESVTARDLVFGDITGAGGSDLMVVTGERVSVYLNHSGQFFSYLRDVTLPVDYGALDRAQAVDLLGLGISQLVVGFARNAPATAYLDLACGRRPLLMTGIDNGMGATTEIHYKSSVDYSLADRAAGRPWLTSLPFPVSVVAEVDQTDAISRTRLVRVAQYSDGYFDPVDRQFAGFGYVQIQDSLAVNPSVWHFPSEGPRAAPAAGSRSARADRARAQEQVAPAVEPLFSRCWQQVGAFEQAAALRARMLADAFHGEGDDLVLPAPALSPAFRDAGAHTLELAFKALAGREVRRERYGVGQGGAVAEVPYSVSQSAFGVELVQPAIDGNPAVVMVVDRESASIAYEQQPDDPFVSHSLAVEVDDFGQWIRTLNVGYARRQAAGRTRLPGQREAMVRLETRGLINHVDGGYHNADGGTTPVDNTPTGGSMHAVALQFEDQAFELSGFAQPAPYFSYAKARELAAAAIADVVPFGEPLSGKQPQARLYRWQRAYFWDEEQAGTALQRTGPQQLLHHHQDGIYSDAFVARAFEGRIDDAYLREQAGYVHDAGYWWSAGYVVSYSGRDAFYLAEAYTDPFGAATGLKYDRYGAMLIEKTDALGFTIDAAYDYQALQPRRIVDENHNVEEFGYDPLAQLLVQTRFGTEAGEVVGDEPLADYTRVAAPSAEAVLADPQRYVQKAAAYYFYDLQAWRREPRTPVCTIEVRRRTFVRPGGRGDSPDGAELAIRVRYFDGSQRRLAVAKLVSGEPPFALFGSVAPTLTARTGPADAPATQWQVTDQQRFDDRGTPVVRYQPYFAATPVYVEAPECGKWTIRYDALYREVATETPKQFLTGSTFRSWSSTVSDEDDTVMRSPYYIKHINDPELPPAEKAALEMAARLADTPVTTSRDALGRDILETTTLVSGADVPDPPPPRPLHTASWYDALDKVRAYADPRFYDPENPDRPRFFNAFIDYDMRGRPARQKGADAGDQPLRRPEDGLPWIRLFDALDAPLDEWDRRDFRHTIEYNLLRLPTGTRVRGNGLDALAERITYGADPDANTVNRIVEHCDQAGIERLGLYSILGEPIDHSRQFRVDTAGVPNWAPPDQPLLQPTVWRWTTRHNAVGDLVQYQAPNGATLATGYTCNGWPRSVALGGGGAAGTTLAEATRLSPNGRPATLAMASGITVDRTYEQDTLRVTRIRAVDEGGGERQDVTYTYDPVGNVTNVDNRLPPAAETPAEQVYRYDSLYRLVTATGRRQPPAGGAIEPYARAYHYDDSGNLAEIADDGGAGVSTRYVVAESSNHAITADMAERGEPDAFFDADGLMITLPDATALAYDPSGRLVEARSPSQTVTCFQYASNGLRARKSAPSGDTYYLMPFIAEGAPAAAAQLVAMLGDQMIAVVDYPPAEAGEAPAPCYQLDDRLHSVVERTDARGNRLDVQAFYPYGETAIYVATAPATRDDKRYQFTGQERDPSTGLYSFAKRYYCPQLSHWITPDPSGTSDGINLFSYVGGNPLTLIDPTGEGREGEEGQQHKTRSSTLPVYSLKSVLSKFNTYGVVTNIIGEVAGGMFHRPPILDLARNMPFRAAWVLQTGQLSGFGALFGGLNGIGYNLIDIKKSGFNFYNTTNLVGQMLFATEGWKIYQSYLLRNEHAFHLAHVRIGYIGFAADLFKVPTYVHKGDYAQVGFYTGLALGNLRSAVSVETAESFYRGMIRIVSAPYTYSRYATQYPAFGQLLNTAPRLLARVAGWQMIAATFTTKLFYDRFFKRTEDKH